MPGTCRKRLSTGAVFGNTTMGKTLAAAVLLILLSGCTSIQPGMGEGSPSVSDTFDAERCQVGAAPGVGVEDAVGTYPLALANDSAEAVEQYVREFERTYAYKGYVARTYDNFSISVSGVGVSRDDGGNATATISRVSIVMREPGTIAEDEYSVTYRLTGDGMTRNDSRVGRPPPASLYNYVVECEAAE